MADKLRSQDYTPRRILFSFLAIAALGSLAYSNLTNQPNRIDLLDCAFGPTQNSGVFPIIEGKPLEISDTPIELSLNPEGKIGFYNTNSLNGFGVLVAASEQIDLEYQSQNYSISTDGQNLVITATCDNSVPFAGF